MKRWSLFAISRELSRTIFFEGIVATDQSIVGVCKLETAIYATASNYGAIAFSWPVVRKAKRRHAKVHTILASLHACSRKTSDNCNLTRHCWPSQTRYNRLPRIFFTLLVCAQALALFRGSQPTNYNFFDASCNSIYSEIKAELN